METTRTKVASFFLTEIYKDQYQAENGITMFKDGAYYVCGICKKQSARFPYVSDAMYDVLEHEKTLVCEGLR